MISRGSHATVEAIYAEERRVQTEERRLQAAADFDYVGLPFLSGGRSRAGLDCAGLAWLWLTEQGLISAPPPGTPPLGGSALETLPPFSPLNLHRGDAVFFSHQRRGKVCHVAIYLGGGRLLNILNGLPSRIENGFVLLRRLNYIPVSALPPSEAGRLCAALSDPALGDAVSIGLLILSIALSVVSGFILRPSASAFKNVTGRYGQTNTGLATQKNPELPLPDVLGQVVLAGNSVYQQLPDKSAQVDNSPPQIWNQIIVFDSAPSALLDVASGLLINGVSYKDKNFHSGANVQGIVLNPTQDRANAVDGSISGDTNVPSVTPRPGKYVAIVPIDVRASYDRSFPVYGMNGSSYLVFRFFDSSKFSNLNITLRIKGRICRQFDNTGFISATSTAESVAGADGAAVFFKLLFGDIKSVASVTVNGTPYTAIGSANQTGNVYQVNATKGVLRFLNAPPAAATILITYDYYPRVYTQNPATHVIYLLTESRRGKGFGADRIDWPSADAARQFFDQQITYVTPDGAVTGARYQCNYSIDARKPIQDHVQSILDACHSFLFLSNGKFILLPVRDAASVFSFNTTNILVDDNGNSTFEADLVDRAPKSNRIRLSFQSEATLNAESEVVADDEDNQLARSGRGGDNGVVDEQLKFPAVTSLSQASRLAETILREHVGSNWLYTWKTNILGLALQPGDIVDVTHPSLPVPAKLLRIESLEHDELDRLKITGSEYVPSAYL